jgi:hypothetical protein
MIYRDDNSLIERIHILQRERNELKSRQFIGSNQIMTYPQTSGKPWDISITCDKNGQIPGSKWGAVIFYVQSEGIDLVADMVVEIDRAMELDSAPFSFPLDPTRYGADFMAWFVPVFGNQATGYTFNIRATVIANAPVTIRAERY